MDAGGERRLLQLLLDGLRLEPVEPRRPYEPACVDEPRELVAREENLLQVRVPWQLEVLGMREDRFDEILRIPELAQDRRSVLRMLVQRGVDLVVEVVEERGGAPEV